jgi:molybdopterin molybdotransferase
MLTYEQARCKVIEKIGKRTSRKTEPERVWDALGFVLAQEVKTDREYPPFNRATRDGYAVFAADAKAGAKLRCTGEIKAGDRVTKELWAETCVQIMTGAAVPSGADAVVMIEQTKRDGDEVRFDRDAAPGQNIVPHGSEARAGQTILSPGNCSACRSHA